jgi:hypothetical protein
MTLDKKVPGIGPGTEVGDALRQKRLARLR